MQNSVEIGELWGFWGTLLWGVLIFLVFNLGQMIPLIGYMAYEGLALTIDSFFLFSKRVVTDSFLLFLAAMGGMVFVVPFVLGIIKFKQGAIMREYLSLNGFRLATLMLSIVTFIVLYLSIGVLTELLGAKETPDFMLNLEYPTLLSKMLLVIAVVVAAPIVEEVVFRGFLLKGFANSFLGVHGAVVLTSLLWAVIHGQYEFIYLFMIFLIGIVFGYARVMTNSLYIPMIMHGLMNFWSVMGLFYLKGVFES